MSGLTWTFVIVSIIETLAIVFLVMNMYISKPDGVLRVLSDTPKNKKYELEWDHDPDTLDTHKRLILDVEPLNADRS